MKKSVEDLVNAIDLPHKRHAGWKWTQCQGSKKEFSRERLVAYAKRLRELGMSDMDISCLFSDLYWDAFVECKENKTFSKRM